MKKVLYIARGRGSFFEIDRKALEERFNVKTLILEGNKLEPKFFLNIITLVCFVFWYSFGAKAIFVWFGDYQSAVVVFLSKLLRKKVIIFSGGTDTICYPEFRKGVFYKRFRAICVRYAFKNAFHIIPNHSSLIYHENFYYSNEGKKDGIKYYIPGIKTPMTVVENGINTERFKRNSKIVKESNLILTVGTMTREEDFITKGFDLFVQMAERSPDLRFTMIGIKKEFLPWIELNYKISLVPNLNFVLFSPVSVLLEFYNKAAVYVQASITEGIPNSMLEAMLCECVPVGSNINGIPDAIAEFGVLVMHRSVIELEQAVRKALEMNTGEGARNHVLLMYSYMRHTERLLKVIDNILK
jgi:glycosyltransferase involved in cell wall biosynthesis